MSLIEPRPGDLWFREVVPPPTRTEIRRYSEIFILVTDRHQIGHRLHSIPVHTVLFTENVRCLGSGRLLLSYPPQPRTFYPDDFEKFELLSRSDEEALGGEASKSDPPSVSGV